MREDEDTKAGAVLMSRARMQIRDWRIPKPMLFSVGRGVSMNRKGRAATRESVDGNEMQIPLLVIRGRVTQAGTGVGNHVSEQTRVAATRSSLCILHMQSLIRLSLNCKISIRPATAMHSVWV